MRMVVAKYPFTNFYPIPYEKVLNLSQPVIALFVRAERVILRRDDETNDGEISLRRGMFYRVLYRVSQNSQIELLQSLMLSFLLS